ncbi:hypothetical protein BPOR_0749g00050 [Botrytis porri]|uniref:Uncharacterized protein n=1 Tax=Botrytis porri TaxID=87229 RepID=A0A4Z1KB38_9HELO|nr:hypothetical protein BPOR_0749g00050 [Botrytis porri]
MCDSNLQAATMKPNSNKMSGSQLLKPVRQQSTQSKDTLTKTRNAIREHQKQIEDFQLNIQKHVQYIAALRQEEQALLKEQTLFEVEKIQRELCDVDKENKQCKVEEKKHEDMVAKQMLVHDVLYEGEF